MNIDDARKQYLDNFIKRYSSFIEEMDLLIFRAIKDLKPKVVLDKTLFDSHDMSRSDMFQIFQYLKRQGFKYDTTYDSEAVYNIVVYGWKDW